MRIVKTLAAAAIAAVGLSTGTLSTAGQALAQEVTLRFQHFISPKGSVPARFMAPWADKVMADSGGRIKIELYPAMQLGGAPPSLFDQIRDGVIDGGWAIPAYTPGRFPEVEAFELPFTSSTNAEATSRAAWEYTQKYMPEQMREVKLLAVHVHGPGVIHKRGDPVMTLEDMNGLKLRGPSRQANMLLEKMGATAVGMPVPAFPESLSKGVVDGGVIPWEIVPPLKVHELADSHTVIGGDEAFYNTYFIWAMNKASYDKLPDDLKKVIDDNSGIETSAWAGRAMDEGDVGGHDVTAGTDNKIHTLSDDERARWKELAAPLVDQWVAEMNDKGLPGDDMLSDARSLIAKHSN